MSSRHALRFVKARTTTTDLRGSYRREFISCSFYCKKLVNLSDTISSSECFYNITPSGYQLDMIPQQSSCYRFFLLVRSFFFFRPCSHLQSLRQHSHNYYQKQKQAIMEQQKHHLYLLQFRPRYM